MNPQLLIGLSASLMFVIALMLYLVDVYKGRVRVAVVSVAMLTLINVSQLGAMIAKEVWYAIPYTVVAIIMNAFVILLGIRNGKFQFKTLDKLVLVGALAGLAAWYITNDAAYNIYILTAVMLFSVIPMIRKTFHDPASETRLPWAITLGASILLLGTITSAQPTAWLVQVRQLALAVLMNVAINQDYIVPPSRR